MKGFEDTFDFLLGYMDTIFSKGWHWFILLGAVLLLMSSLFNGCTPTDIQPLNRNESINISMNESFNQSYGSPNNNYTRQINRTIENGSG